MGTKKKKILVIVGPTASGKSELAVKFAKKIGGEIISADSRQVYKGLDIGTGKVKGKWKIIHEETNFGKPGRGRALQAKREAGVNVSRNFVSGGIIHYCIDFVNPKKVFTARDFEKCAVKAVETISSKGKMPIVAGGTGFYIDALLYGALPHVPPNWKLRRELERLSLGALFAILKKLDPARAKSVDKKNKRRLVRAVEIIRQTGREVPRRNKMARYDAEFIGIKIPKAELSEKIKKRVTKMVNAGLVSEVKKLIKSKVPKKRIRELGFEYLYPMLYINGEISKREMAEKIISESVKYARRQMTWFKKEKRIRWIRQNPA